jgi:hypothetical protein
LSYLKFNDSYSQYGLYKLEKINETLVRVENIAENNFSGFKLYTLNGQIMGDYSDFKYDYKPQNTEQNVFYYSSVKGYNVNFVTNGGGDLKGTTDFYVLDYKDLVVPTPQPHENFKFLDWSIDIPKSGVITEPLEIIANFEYVPQLEDIQNQKIQEFSETSEQVIAHGVDIELSDKKVEHFEFSLYDQTNISNALTCCNILQSQNVKNAQIPLYSQGNICKLYNIADIYKIYLTMQMVITSNLTLAHQLEQQIKSCKTIEEVQNMTYEISSLKGEFLTNYNLIMQKSQEMLKDVQNTH